MHAHVGARDCPPFTAVNRLRDVPKVTEPAIKPRSHDAEVRVSFTSLRPQFHEPLCVCSPCVLTENVSQLGVLQPPCLLGEDTGHHCPSENRGFLAVRMPDTAESDGWCGRLSPEPWDLEAERKTQSTAHVLVACALWVLSGMQGVSPHGALQDCLPSSQCGKTGRFYLKKKEKIDFSLLLN